MIFIVSLQFIINDEFIRIFRCVMFRVEIFFFIFHVFNIFESFNIENGLRVTPRIQKHSGMFIDASCPTFTFMNLYDWNIRMVINVFIMILCEHLLFNIKISATVKFVYNSLIKGLYKVCFVHHYILEMLIQ